MSTKFEMLRTSVYFFGLQDWSDDMLRRVISGRFEGDEGDQIQIVTRTQANNGVNDARFEYAGNVLPRQTIQGLPGCTFTIVRDRKQFEAVVAFDPAAGDGARYDVFEIDAAGGLIDLREHVSKLDGSPLIAFAVDGVPALAAAAVPKGMPAAPRTVAKKKRTAATKPARKAAAKKATPASRKKTRTKSAPGKRTAKRARKQPASRTSRANRRTAARKRR